jgi:hypothetical protein
MNRRLPDITPLALDRQSDAEVNVAIARVVGDRLRLREALMRLAVILAQVDPRHPSLVPVLQEAASLGDWIASLALRMRYEGRSASRADVIATQGDHRQDLLGSAAAALPFPTTAGDGRPH